MVEFAGSPVATDDFQKIELFISCRKLKDLDVFSKSDPRVIVYLDNGKGFSKIGQTETMKNNLDPNFTTSIYCDFFFEIKQTLKFEVQDDDGKGKYELIGEATTTVGAVAGAKNQTTILDLHNKGTKSTGKIIIKADRVQESRENIYMQWVGVKLANVDGIFDKSDPFLRFLRKTNTGTDWLITHQTEHIMDNLNPVWKGFWISSQKLCNGDQDSPLTIECWDWEKSGKYKLIGSTSTTLRELKSGKKEHVLQHPKKKHPGTLKLNAIEVKETPTFFDYIRGGEQLNFIAAVDFTGSNGIPTHPTSLHALKTGGFNQYQQALYSVGEIILNYDYDKMVPMFGFGGKPRFPGFTTDKVLHCFPMTGNPTVAEVPGLQGMMDAYQNALLHVELSGPTFFTPIISGAAEVAKAGIANNVYTVLLIITDGEIHDMKETVDKIVECQYIPLSIIIIGVGNESFDNMKRLDADEGKLRSSNGVLCNRDLVQFVPIKNFLGNQAALAKEVLAEVPKQLVEYKMSVGKKPNPPMQHLTSV